MASYEDMALVMRSLAKSMHQGLIQPTALDMISRSEQPNDTQRMARESDAPLRDLQDISPSGSKVLKYLVRSDVRGV